jgi:hypothetical protein
MFIMDASRFRAVTVSDTLVLILTALLALGVLGWAVWAVWHIARHTPTRQHAMSHVLGIIAGAALLGVAPSRADGDPFPIWLAYAVLAVGYAVVLAWLARACRRGREASPAW